MAGQLLTEVSASHDNSLLTDQEPMESKDLDDFDIALFHSLSCAAFAEMGWAAGNMLLLRIEGTGSGNRFLQEWSYKDSGDNGDALT